MNAIELAERGLLPDAVLRAGVRRLLRVRLRDEATRHADRERTLAKWVGAMDEGPIAPLPEAANAQHYEVPPAFYQLVLGKHLKYSSGYWPEGTRDLDQAEAAMLALTIERADLRDGQRILELGCGWGSLTLEMARRFPRASIVAVSNSRPQREHIEAAARARGLDNVSVITCDMNAFAPEGLFDRVVSVEMFEHMRNWRALLGRVRSWMTQNGSLFLHVFAHARFAYPFETERQNDWMGRHFFTGGMMPSLDLVDRVADPFVVDARWVLDGRHYARTARAWQRKLQRSRAEAIALFEPTLGPREARRNIERWNLFFIACDELFGYADGQEWLVAHYRLSPRDGAPA